MPIKHISIVIALIVMAGAVTCGTELAVAQSAAQPPSPSSGGFIMPPPMPPTTNVKIMHGGVPPTMQTDGRMMPTVQEGSFDQGRMMPSPPQNSNYGQPGEYRMENQSGMPTTQSGGSSGQQFGAPQPWGGNGGNGENDANADARDQQMRKQQLDQMKRNIKGMEQGVAQTKKMIDRLVKKGIAVPAEYSTVVTELQSAFATVKASKEQSDEVEVAMETIMDKSDTIREIGPKLGMLEQWPKMLSQAEQQIKKLNTAITKAKKKKGADQYAAVIAKVESAVSSVGAKYAEIKQLGGAGDIETAMDGMQDLPELIGDAQREIGVLDQMSNLAKMIKSTEKEITNFEKQVARLSKKGTDVGKVTAIITEARAKVAELKALGTSSSAEPEDFFDVMQELDEYRKEATDAFNALNGRAGSLEGAVIYALRQLREGR